MPIRESPYVSIVKIYNFLNIRRCNIVNLIRISRFTENKCLYMF